MVDDGKPINILLVEDNDDDIHITLRAFKKAKVQNAIAVVRNGQEGMDYLLNQDKFENQNNKKPDLILLDINMPIMDGFEMLDCMRKVEGLERIQVVMLTSSKNDEDIAKSYKTGAVSYIQKPVEYSDFIEIVEGFNFYWQIINKFPAKEETQ